MIDSKYRCWNTKDKRWSGCMVMVDLTQEPNVYWIHPTQPDCILMQYTGFKDRNGKEIYEGDIVKITEGFSIKKGEVLWDNEMASFIVLGAKYDEVVDLDTIESIIGNIYENPEFLEEK